MVHSGIHRKRVRRRKGKKRVYWMPLDTNLYMCGFFWIKFLHRFRCASFSSNPIMHWLSRTARPRPLLMVNDDRWLHKSTIVITSVHIAGCARFHSTFLAVSCIATRCKIDDRSPMHWFMYFHVHATKKRQAHMKRSQPTVSIIFHQTKIVITHW